MIAIINYLHLFTEIVLKFMSLLIFSLPFPLLSFWCMVYGVSVLIFDTMVGNSVLPYMQLKKHEMQELYWDEKHLILIFKDRKFERNGDGFIQGVWEVVSLLNDAIIASAFYAANDEFDIHKMGQFIEKTLKKMPDLTSFM